jgi:hypothetical protein
MLSAKLTVILTLEKEGQLVSPVPFDQNNAAELRHLCEHSRRIPEPRDWLAERDEFELAVPFLHQAEEDN